MIYNIYIFCGGKCGGTTLAKTFTLNNYKTIHLHGFDYVGLYSSDIDILNIHDTMDSCKEDIFIIDVYRTPIERKISGFFHNIDLFLPNFKMMTIEDIIDFFNISYLIENENAHPIDEALTYYNVPLFTEFDFGKKYNIIKQSNKIFVKLLFKDIHNWDTILSEIIGKQIIMYNDNLTINRDIGSLYEAFKLKYKVPKNYLNMLDNEFKIYNTIEDQDNYIKKWSEKSC